MKTRLPIILLMAAGILASLPEWAGASIVLDYRFPADRVGVVQLDPSPNCGINLDIQEGAGVLTLLFDGETFDGTNARPILQIRPTESKSAETAIADKSYLSFSIKPAGGKGIALRSLEFDVADEMGSASYGCIIQSSVGGFGTKCPVMTPRIVPNDTPGSTHYCVDLSDPSFQDLREIDFRLYFYSSKPSGPLKFDGVAVKGEVIVAPEPSSAIVWFFLAVLVTFVVALWAALREESVQFACATAYPAGNSIMSIRRGARGRVQQNREPWPEHVRASILEVIERGRTR